MTNFFENKLIFLEEKNQELIGMLNSLEGKCSLLNEQIIKNEQNLQNLSHKKIIYIKSIELLTIIQNSIQEKIQKGFNSMLTYALRYVFNDDYKFELNFSRRGNLQEIDFNVLPPGREEATDPMDSSGGGVLDIISFALRVILMELSKPKIEGFIALDESFKHLSTHYLPNAYKLLKEINKKTERQIILVTHQSQFQDLADKSIEIKEE